MTTRIELPLPATAVPPLTKVEKSKPAPIPLPPPLTAVKKVQVVSEQETAPVIPSLTPPPLTVIRAQASSEEDEWLDDNEGDENYEDSEREHTDEGLYGSTQYDDGTSDDQFYDYVSAAALQFKPTEVSRPFKTALEPVEALGWPNPSSTSQNVSQAPQIASNRPSIASLFVPDESVIETPVQIAQTVRQPHAGQARYYLTFFKFADESKPHLIELNHFTEVPEIIPTKLWFETKIRDRYHSTSQGPIAEAKARGKAYIRETPDNSPYYTQDTVYRLMVLEQMENYPTAGSIIGEYWVQGFKDNPIQIA